MEGYKYNSENGIYYHNTYASYEDFIAKVLLDWVLARCQLLLDFKQQEPDHIDQDQKIQLQQTEIGIRSTATSDDDFVQIMGSDFHPAKITVDHMIHLVKYLQDTLPDPTAKLGASNLIKELETNTDDVYLDLSYLYPQPTVTKRAS
jgi:hypothetical protein